MRSVILLIRFVGKYLVDLVNGIDDCGYSINGICDSGTIVS